MREYLDGTSHLVTWICLHRELGAVTRQRACPRRIDALADGGWEYWCALIELEEVRYYSLFSANVTPNVTSRVTVMVMLLLTVPTRG